MEKRQSLSTRGRKTVGTTGEGAGKELWSLGVDLRILCLVEQRAGFPAVAKKTWPIQNQNKESSTKHFIIQHAHTQYSLPPSGFIHQPYILNRKSIIFSTNVSMLSTVSQPGVIVQLSVY
jgi:hypothetical protein